MEESQASAEREEMLARWDEAAPGWARHADQLRRFGMPVSLWLIEHLELQPGHRVLELAAGPGDTGFMAAELVRPGGMLVSSDGSAAMLDIARARSRELGIDNVEFKLLQLEWIDLPAASVDAALCRWGFMLTLDPDAAARETRRVLRPGGRLALAVWDSVERNPWASVPARTLISLGHASPPDPSAPGMFALAAPGRLQEMLETTGFTEVVVAAVDVPRSHASVEEYFRETLELSRIFAEPFAKLSGEQQAQVRERLVELAAPFTQADGSVLFPGSALVAAASA